MLQQHGKPPDDGHEQTSFRFDRKMNSGCANSCILKENQYLHNLKFLCACMTTACEILCTTGKAMLSLFYFGLVFHIRTSSNFEGFELQCVNTKPHAILHKVFYSFLISLFNLPYSMTTDYNFNRYTCLRNNIL